MTYEEALRKATSCLRLAKSSNAAEAALAASKAQEIMDRYNITIAAADLEKGQTTYEEPIQDFGRETVLTACQKDKNWSLRLTSVVAQYNGCKTYYRPHCGGSASFLIGRASDVQTARYMISLLAEEVRRLARDHTKGYSEKYRRDFRYGVVEAIDGKFYQQWKKTQEEVRAESAGNPLALVRINTALTKMGSRLAEIEKWSEENMNLNKGGKSRLNLHADARAHGRQVGQESITLNRSKGGLGSGAGAGSIVKR